MPGVTCGLHAGPVACVDASPRARSPRARSLLRGPYCAVPAAPSLLRRDPIHFGATRLLASLDRRLGGL